MVWGSIYKYAKMFFCQKMTWKHVKKLFYCAFRLLALFTSSSLPPPHHHQPPPQYLAPQLPPPLLHLPLQLLPPLHYLIGLEAKDLLPSILHVCVCCKYLFSVLSSGSCHTYVVHLLSLSPFPSRSPPSSPPSDDNWLLAKPRDSKRTTPTSKSSGV